MSALLARLRQRINQFTTRMSSSSTSSSSTTSTNHPASAADDLPPDSVVDLWPLTEYLPSSITALVEQYISVECECVEVNNNPPPPMNNENRVICVAMMPAVTEHMQLKYVEVFVRSHDQGRSLHTCFVNN